MEPSEYMQYKETRLHDQPGFSCNIYLCNIPLNFSKVELHWHDQMEIIYIKNGKGKIQISLQNYDVEKGCIVPILPGELHSITCLPKESMDYENIIFSLSALDSSDPDDWCRDHVLKPLKERSMLFERILRPGTDFHLKAAETLDSIDEICSVRTPGYSLLVKAELLRLLYHIYENRLTDAGTADSEDAEHLKEILGWIRENYRKHLTVENAAEVSGYSSSHFMRLFKEQTGRTFLNWLTEYRLSAAAIELRETDKPIHLIAEECGFENLSYFDRRFRAHFGMSPKQYRKNQ